MIHWFTTSSPRLAYTHAPSAITGWLLHAVEAPEDAKFSEIKSTRAACGLVPRHGWALDLFIERKCERCLRITNVSWYLYISTHSEMRKEREIFVYTPVAIPADGNVQDLRCRYCPHRHTSIDAARRCGDRLVREAVKAELSKV